MRLAVCALPGNERYGARLRRRLGARAGRAAHRPGGALSRLHAPGQALPAGRGRHLGAFRLARQPRIRLACHRGPAPAPPLGAFRDLRDPLPRRGFGRALLGLDPRARAPAARLRALGFARPSCVGVHAVFAPAATDRLKAAGFRAISTTDTIAHETNAMATAGLVADAVACLSAPR